MYGVVESFRGNYRNIREVVVLGIGVGSKWEGYLLGLYYKF